MTEDYTTTEGTPWHVLGGLLMGLLSGPVLAGLFWGVCMLAYQIYDSTPRDCLDWEHTKYDCLEIGVGALVSGVAWMAWGVLA